MTRLSAFTTFRSLFAVAGLLVGLAAATPVSAQSSSIKVIVNDHAITSMEIASRARLLQLANKIPAGKSTKAATEELIDEALHLQEASNRGVNISDAMVASAIADIAGRSKLSPKQFAKALSQAGVQISSLEERLRAQMAWGRIVRAKVQQSTNAEKNDLIAQMRRQETAANAVTAEDYIIQRIVFTLPANANASKVGQRRKEAEALRSRFKGCDAGLELAKALKEVAVINVGRKLASEVPAGLRDELKATAEGALTKPQPGPNGVEMYAICKKFVVNGENALSNDLDAEAMSAQAKQVSDSLTSELRQRANIVYR